MRVVSLGAHILDVLGRPLGPWPPSGNRVLLETAAVTAAGTAAGTSVDLAKLGCDVVAMGAIGDDTAGRLVTMLLGEHGVDTRHLAIKRDHPTSTTMLTIGADGERCFTMHLPGATPHLREGDIDLDVIDGAVLLHVGAADVLGDFAREPLVRVLRRARSRGILTTMDLLTHCNADTLRRLEPALAEVDHFLPNAGQIAGLTGHDDPVRGARALIDLGPSWVVATEGADGSILVGRDGVTRQPTLAAEVVDTTGCGDAFDAGYIAGLVRGWTPDHAVWLGAAAASLVAQGLGSDAGIVDFASTVALVADRVPAAATPVAQNAV
jgi:sugar/nucleoside kinase (ribokinase family)